MTLPPADKTSHSHLPFHGQVVVFTGKLVSVGRREARELIERLGGEAAENITSQTTMLIVGAASADPSKIEGGQTVELRKAAEINVETSVSGTFLISPERLI